MIIDPNGMWEQDADGNWTAEKGDSWWSLHKQSGMSWKETMAIAKDYNAGQGRDNWKSVRIGDQVSFSGGETSSNGGQSGSTGTTSAGTVAGPRIDISNSGSNSNNSTGSTGTDQTSNAVNGIAIGNNVKLALLDVAEANPGKSLSNYKFGTKGLGIGLGLVNGYQIYEQKRAGEISEFEFYRDQFNNGIQTFGGPIWGIGWGIGTWGGKKVVNSEWYQLKVHGRRPQYQSIFSNGN